jgi:hypothetical protein
VPAPPSQGARSGAGGPGAASAPAARPARPCRRRRRRAAAAAAAPPARRIPDAQFPRRRQRSRHRPQRELPWRRAHQRARAALARRTMRCPARAKPRPGPRRPAGPAPGCRARSCTLGTAPVATPGSSGPEHLYKGLRRSEIRRQRAPGRPGRPDDRAPRRVEQPSTAERDRHRSCLDARPHNKPAHRPVSSHGPAHKRRPCHLPFVSVFQSSCLGGSHIGSRLSTRVSSTSCSLAGLLEGPRGSAARSMAFLPYLPQDNASLADATVAAISERLGQLLRAPASQFWAAVRGDASLHTCLDSYLQYARFARGLVCRRLPSALAGWRSCRRHSGALVPVGSKRLAGCSTLFSQL